MGRALRAPRARGVAVRRRHVPAAAADRLRRGRLRGRAVPRWRAPPAGGRSWSTRARASRTPARFPDAEEVVAAWPEEAFARLGGIDRATSIAVLTHDPKLDDAALVHRAALRRRATSARWARAARRRSAASGCSRRGIDRRRAGAHLRADRPRPRRADRRGDRAVDHGRDRRGAPRARRAAASRTRRAGSTRSACDDRRARPRRRRGPPLRRRQAARRAATAARCWSTRSRAVSRRPRSTAWSSCSAHAAEEIRARVDLQRRRAGGLRRLGGGPGRPRCAAAWRRWTTPTRCVVALGDQPRHHAAAIEPSRDGGRPTSDAARARPTTARPAIRSLLRPRAARARRRAARRRGLPRSAVARRGCGGRGAGTSPTRRRRHARGAGGR